MPTDLPLPRDWQAFEDLCCDLWRRLWNDPEAQKNGRSGQDQAGVDIVGRENGTWVGVQCKHRKDRAVLSRQEIEDEVRKARDFPRKLRKLLIATTGPSDTEAIQAAGEITERHRLKDAFEVKVVFWEDLQVHLFGHPDLLAKHYPDLAAIFGESLPRPSDETLLGLWLQEVAADHRQLTPLFQSQGEIDLLQRVYVELQVTPGLGRERLSARSDLGAAPVELREVLALDPADHPWITRRWVVLGDPGAGKTTLLRHFTASLATDPARSWVPVFWSLPKLLRGEEFLLDPIARRVERLGQSGTRMKALLEQLGRAGRLLVLLDGLDEVPSERSEEAEQVLRGLAGRWPASPIVVSSRPIGYHRPGPDFQELALLPLDRALQREFLARWLGRVTGTPDPVRAAAALAALDSPELRELAGNPLYLTLMALLVEDGVEPDRNRTRLYDQVFKLLFEGRHHGREREPLEAQETVRTVLRRLAYDMTVDNVDAEPVTALEKRLWDRECEELRLQLQAVPGWSRMRQFLDDLAQKTGILGDHDGPEADWRFWHRTFREALTAEQLADDLRNERARPGLLTRLWPTKAGTALPARARKIRSEGDLSRWAEPFALLVGHVEQPDALVRALVRRNRPLGLRALATAQRLSDETLDEVLSFSGTWQRRAEVYRRVPDLVGEPGRALALLDRLRRRSRNGNDLYALDLAVQEVARRSPEAAREAAEIRARFFDHIPPPPEDLFRWIDTPYDGRVPLWREIPAGRFWMGSPEGEVYDREWPREVTIAASFCCAAVPVTNAQYAAFDPLHEPHIRDRVKAEESPHHPVAGITWYEACSFCRWLAVSFPWARGTRLPTEEEWEYACRAGSSSHYWSGDGEEDLARVGWYAANSGRRTHRVGEKPANPWGLYDVHGNVWEWTLSAWKSSDAGRESGFRLDPAEVVVSSERLPRGGGRVVRGGSCWNDADYARGACRNFGVPGFEVDYRGFRVVFPAVPELLIRDLRS